MSASLWLCEKVVGRGPTRIGNSVTGAGAPLLFLTTFAILCSEVWREPGTQALLDQQRELLNNHARKLPCTCVVNVFCVLCSYLHCMCMAHACTYTKPCRLSNTLVRINALSQLQPTRSQHARGGTAVLCDIQARMEGMPKPAQIYIAQAHVRCAHSLHVLVHPHSLS